MDAHYCYYPVNLEQKKWGIYLTCAGRHTIAPGAPFPEKDHPDEYYFTWKQGRILPEWQILLVADGRGTLEFRHARATVAANTLVALPPGCWHRYRPDKKTGWSTYWIGFGGDLADRLAGTTVFDMNGDWRVLNAASPVKKLFAATVADLLSTGNEHPFSAAAKIPVLLAAIAEEPSRATDDPAAEALVIKAQTYISEHLAETIEYERLAEFFGVPYRSFRYQFVTRAGVPPLQYQLDLRIVRAKSLLASTDWPIMKIGSLLGFNSMWYFSNYFRKRTGKSPSEYRGSRFL